MNHRPYSTLSRKKVLIFNIDGLRHDTFHRALDRGLLPNLARLVGRTGSGRSVSECNASGHGGLGHGMHCAPLAPLPTITFTCQASIITGLSPAEHGITGNQFFDRLGETNGGRPRYYAFDIGESLAFDDAVAVFREGGGLADRCLRSEARTLYDIGRDLGLTSTVVHHMYSRGADHWLRPSVLHLARFKKGVSWLGMSPEEFDDRMVRKALAHLAHSGMPDLFLIYFMGVDYTSHRRGPEAQEGYVVSYVDRKVGEVMSAIEQLVDVRDLLIAVVSDHGQILTADDESHSLRVGRPLMRGYRSLFEALGLVVHNKPWEDDRCDVMIGANGGLAQIYLRHEEGDWKRPPSLRLLRRVADGFLEGHRTGSRAPTLRGALSAILVRNAEADGWRGPYRVYLGDGTLVDLDDPRSPFHSAPELEVRQRLAALVCSRSGDLLIVPNQLQGFSFGLPVKGNHGGPSAEESRAVMSFGWPGASETEQRRLESVVEEAIASRRRRDGLRSVYLEDLVHVLTALLQ